MDIFEVFRRFFLLLVIFLCIPLDLSSQTNLTPVLRNYTTEDGLPSTQIYQIKQDSKGFIWFATDYGISRFDGNEFKNFNLSNGLCTATLFGTYEDHQGLIWFYSYLGELIYYDYRDNKIHCPSFNSELKKVINVDNLLNGVIRVKDTLFAFNYSGQTYKIILQNDTAITFDNTEEAVLIKSYSEGIISGFSNSSSDANGTFIINDFTSEKSMRFKTKIKLPDPKFSLSSAIKTKKSDYLISVEMHLFRYNFSNLELEVFPLGFGTTQSLYEDQSGLIWMGTYSDGVYAYELSDSLRLIHHFLKGYTVTNILQDNFGGYWFSTQDRGVFYSPNLSTFYLNDMKLASTTRELLSDGKFIYYSTRDGEIHALNTFTFEKFTLYINEDKREIRNIYIYDNTLIFSVKNKLHKFKGPKSVGCFPFQNKIEYILDRGAKNLILGSDSGNYYIIQGTIDSSTTKFIFTNPTEEKIRNITLSELGNIYFSTKSSLFHYDSKTKTTSTILIKGKQKEINVTSINTWKGDSSWVTTRNRGVLLVYKDSIIKTLDNSNGLNRNDFDYVFIDSNFLYLSSDNGIYRIENPYNINYKVASFSKLNGLISNDVSKCIRLKNKLYATTNKGLCVIDKSIFSKVKSKIECKIIMDEHILSHKNEENQFVLPYNFDDFTINYRAISFENAFNIPYRYRLQSNNEWIYSDQLQVTYSNLSPNDYHFEVQAADLDNNWSKSAIFHFSVEAPFWQKPYFIILFIFTLVSIILLIYTLRIRNIKRINNLKTALILNQSKAMSAQMNPHFVFNSLNSISNSIMNNDLRTSVLFLGKMGKLMRMVFENSQETFITITEELEALQMYFSVEKIRLREKLTYSIVIEDSIDPDSIYIPALLLQPFAENAIWHGIAPKEEGGLVKINLSKKNKYLLISIIDNGIGIKNENSKYNFEQKSGINTTIKRIELIRKIYHRDINFSIEPIKLDNEIFGTRVLLTIPIITSTTTILET